MALKTFKPYTKSTRGTVVIDKSSLWKGAPYKPLTKGQNFTGGRNNYGRITSRHIGGGSKHKYRVIDFYRKKKNVSATVDRIEYDPNRTAYIALITYKDNEKSYIICPQGLKVGDTIADIREGKNAGCDTVGVLSGSDTVSMLRKENPNFIVNNITNMRFI